MDTKSIKDIREIKNRISELIKTYKTEIKNSGYDLNQKFGSEEEYSIYSLIGGVRNILTDISTLTKSHNLYLKISSYTERENLKNNLVSLESYLINNQFSNIVTVLDTIKVILRHYNLRYDKERLIEFNEVIDKLNIRYQELEELIENIETNSQQTDETVTEIEGQKEKFDAEYKELLTNKTELVQQISQLKQQQTEFQNLLSTVNSTNNQIQQLFNNAKSNEKIIITFSENISKRENQLSEQEIKTKEYLEKLAEFTAERELKLTEAKKLINSAKDALRFKSAEGISAAFSTQYDKADEKWSKIGWLIGAIAFLIIALGLGIWVITGWQIENPDSITTIIGRFALISLSILGALFSANQYVKQKNLAEDYAYKTVLSKSLIAFSEELRDKSPDKYSEYISVVLNEIHKDPLRKRTKDDDKDITSNLSVYGKIFEFFKQVTK